MTFVTLSNPKNDNLQKQIDDLKAMFSGAGKTAVATKAQAVTSVQNGRLEQIFQTLLRKTR